MAIGAVSLAVAKTGAMLDGNPLYLNIALLKHHQVRIRYTPLQGPVSVSRPCFPGPFAFRLFQEQPAKLTLPLLMVSLVSCGKASPGKLNLMKELICIPHPGLTAKQVLSQIFSKQKPIMEEIFVYASPRPMTPRERELKYKMRESILGSQGHGKIIRPQTKGNHI